MRDWKAEMKKTDFTLLFLAVGLLLIAIIETSK